MERLAIALTGQDEICLLGRDLGIDERIALRGDIRQGPKRLVYWEGCLYVANLFSGSVCKIDLMTKEQRELCIGKYMTGIGRARGKLFAICGETDSLFAIDLENFECIERLQTGDFPLYLSVSPCERYLVISCLGDKSVYVVDTSTLETVRKIQLDSSVYCGAMDEEQNLYIAHEDPESWQSGKLTKLDADGKVVFELSIGNMPNDVCLSENWVGVSCMEKRTLTVAHRETGSVVFQTDEIPMPDQLAFCRQGVVALSMAVDRVFYIDMSGKTVKSRKVGKEPRGICLISEEEKDA